MKRKRTYIVLSICILTVMLITMLLLTACTDDNYTDNRELQKAGKQVELCFDFSPLQGSSATSRSVARGMDVTLGADDSSIDTRALTSAQEEKIENICVFQFEGTPGASTAVLKSKTYLGDLIDRLAKADLQVSTACFVYICANVGDVTGGLTVGTSTYQDILNAELAVSGQGDFSSLLPMSGISGAVNTQTMEATDKIAVTLTRMVAKVSFTFDLSALPVGDGFIPINTTLRNVPKEVKYVAPATGTLNAGTEVDSYLGTDAVTNANTKTTTYVWYMPENLRGTGTAIANWTERIEKNAPLYASYIELTGNYYSKNEDKTYEVTYSLYLGNATDVDNYDVARNHVYTANVKLKGINLADQRVTTNTNLSADGLANCYLASKPGQWYHFNGTVRGNGNTTDYAASQYAGLSLMPSKVESATDAVTVPAEDIADAVVVWETTKGMIEKVQWDANNGRVKFKTGTDANTMEGNALIAVRNSAKEILWSWHIWRTSFNLEELNQRHTIAVKTNTKRSFYEDALGITGQERDLVMMDRNLGARSDAGTIEGNKGANCLHYQFGRKDPFPAGIVYNTAAGQVDGDISLYGQNSDDPNIVSEYKVVDKTVAFSSLSITDNAKEVIDYVINHPEKFIHNISAPNSWIYTNPLNEDNSLKISQCLWGDQNLLVTSINPGHSAVDNNPWDGGKTIYDPSPAGWRVAPSDLLSGIARDIERWYALTLDKIMISDTWNVGLKFEIIANSSTINAFFPASGSRYGSNGTLNNAGTRGFIWYSSPSAQKSQNGSALHLNEANITLASGQGLASGISIRCVKE